MDIANILWIVFIAIPVALGLAGGYCFLLFKYTDCKK